MNLRDKIQEMLDIRDMRPADLSRASGVSAGLISDVLAGKREGVTLSTAKKLAKGLGIDVRYLIENDTIGPRVILSHLSKEEAAFVVSEEAAPFVKLTARAAKEGVTPEQLELLIRAVVNHSKKKL